ncbi:MAG: phosphate signaling complex protein PhoU [Lachnospiraceae bacterium]|jgi:phosphate transport system protein
MRIQFDQQLEQLNLELIKMGSLCEEAIQLAVARLLGEENAGESDVWDLEDKINHKERDIETLCMKLLLRQQPVSRDLRKISSALKMISDMERIGDQANDISDMAKFVLVRENAHKTPIFDMAEATTKMVKESIDSFVRKDLLAAREVVDYDDVVDELFVKVKEELIALAAKDASNSEYYIDLVMIAKYFERIGDHAENIAEWVIYSITGVHEKKN